MSDQNPTPTGPDEPVDSSPSPESPFEPTPEPAAEAAAEAAPEAAAEEAVEPASEAVGEAAPEAAADEATWAAAESDAAAPEAEPEPAAAEEPAAEAAPEPVAPEPVAPEAAAPAAAAGAAAAAAAAAVPPPPPPPASYPPPPPPPPGYAPPPAYGAAPVPAVARPGLSIGEALSYGWKGFTANVGSILLIVLVVVAVNLGLNWLASASNNDFVTFLFSLVAFVVSFVIALGLIRAALTITDGQKPNVGELFRGEGVVQYALAAILLGVAFALLNFIGLVTFLLLPITFVATLVLGFFVQFFGYAILDENVGAIDGIRRSFEVVKGNFGELLLLWLAAVGINILGALACGIGLLVTLPVTAIAWAFAWRRLTGGPIAALA